jgi:hypothetical protein
MLGSNPSADSVASTDVGGCYGIPLSSAARKRANHRERHSSVKSWGRGGKAPAGCASRQLTTEARAPSHNAYDLRGQGQSFKVHFIWASIFLQDSRLGFEAAAFKGDHPTLFHRLQMRRLKVGILTFSDGREYIHIRMIFGSRSVNGGHV